MPRRKLSSLEGGYDEGKMEEALRMVKSFKWSQKAVSQAFNIPRQTLADRLKKDDGYKNRSSYKVCGYI